MQIVWQLFFDSAYNKGMLACTAAESIREQADTAVALCLLSICREGQQSSSAAAHTCCIACCQLLLFNAYAVLTCLSPNFLQYNYCAKLVLSEGLHDTTY